MTRRDFATLAATAAVGAATAIGTSSQIDTDSRAPAASPPALATKTPGYYVRWLRKPDASTPIVCYTSIVRHEPKRGVITCG